jgi:hypothetical protein
MPGMAAKRLPAAALLSVVLACATALQAQEIVKRGEPFDLHVTTVRSLDHDSRVGFSKAWELYAVTGYGPKNTYVLYCTKAAPKAGQVYSALDDYVDANHSWLHLWPVEKNTLELPPGHKKKGRLYAVIIIQNVLPEPQPPDLACDINSETALGDK